MFYGKEGSIYSTPICFSRLVNILRSFRRTLPLSIEDPQNQLLFGMASVWEVAIKFSQGRSNCKMSPPAFRQDLFDAGYEEIPILSEHAIHVSNLPLIHKDPFDRILIAQATVEGITLLTSDALMAHDPGPIRLV